MLLIGRISFKRLKNTVVQPPSAARSAMQCFVSCAFSCNYSSAVPLNVNTIPSELIKHICQKSSNCNSYHVISHPSEEL